MSTAETWTVGRLLTWTTDFLKKHNSESPRLDAEVLLAEARGCQRIQLYTAFEEVVDEATRGKFRELVKRRGDGTPVAYLVGRKEFYSLALKVTPDVLIPRPETEHAVVAVVDHLKELGAARDPAVRIADVGTGSGAIAIAVAKHAPHVSVTAIDISPAALEVAKANAQTHQVADRILFLNSDLFASVQSQPPFDIIVSNPPYVTESEWSGLEPGVRDFEPKLALVGGVKGWEVTARLIKEAAERLVPGGWLVLEIHSGHEAHVHKLIVDDGRFAEPTTIKDLANLPRIVQAKRS